MENRVKMRKKNLNSTQPKLSNKQEAIFAAVLCSSVFSPNALNVHVEALYIEIINVILKTHQSEVSLIYGLGEGEAR